MAKRYGMVIDARKCTGCQSCVVACKTETNLPTGVWRNWVAGIEKGSYPEPGDAFLPKLCNQCENPPCVQVCPTEASFKRDDGIVLVRPHRCIGCGLCIAACPYDARFFTPLGTPQYADKCTFCYQRVDEGLLPACVEACPNGAITFGDLNDPTSEVSRLLAANQTDVIKQYEGTLPSVFYIGADWRLLGRVTYADDFHTEIEEYNQHAPSPLKLPGVDEEVNGR